MSKITNLQIYAPNPKDITSLYRAVGPLSQLRKSYPSLNITIHEKLEWHQLKMSDIVFLQRPWLDTHLQIAEIAKDIGSPLWVDWDDDLTSIPKSNVHKVHYNSPKLPENIKQIADLADIISVTTTSLKNNVLKDFQTKVRIIPNALEDRYYTGLDTIDYNERKAIVAWRGGQSHNIDLMDVRDQLIALSKAHTAWSFAFLGYEPTMQMHGMREGSWGSIPNQDFGAYMQSLKTMSPPIMMVPLANDRFNESKCLVPGTKLITENGIETIENIKENTKVWQEKSFEIATKTIKYEKKKTKKLITKEGYEIEGTLNHKLRSNGEFKPISEFKIGDILDLSTFKFAEVSYQEVPMDTFKQQNRGIIDRTKVDFNLIPKVKITEDWGLFFGILLGDGFMNKYSTIGIAMADKHLDMQNFIKSFAERLGLSTYTRMKDTGQHGMDMFINSTILRDFVANKVGFCGVRGKILKVPDVIYKSPKSVIAAFLKGIFDTDGTVNESSCSFCTKQQELAKEVQFLLLGFGIKSKIQKTFNKIYNKNYYVLYLGREATDLFYKEIGFLNKDKQNKLKTITEKSHSNAYKVWKLQAEVSEIIEAESDVYDIEVPNNHYYCANGIVSHNSHIAWLEASIAGSLVVAPEYVPDFVRPGVLTYKNNKQFGDLMHTIMGNPGVVESANKQSLQYIGDVLLLSKVNEQRKQLIKDLQELLK